MYYLAALLLIFIGIAHSYLGERYILSRLFRRDNIPKTLGSTEFTKNTLRFAWHLTTVAWFGFAAILMHLAVQEIDEKVVANIISLTFLIHFFIALVASKGRHFSWVFFLIISIAVLYTVNI